MKQLEAATQEIARIVEVGMRFVLEQIEEPKDATILRKFGRAYEKLSTEDIAAVLAASGPELPNDVSRLIARKEMSLREE